MENETKPQLFIMDERLGDPIPLAEIKEISEPTPVSYTHLTLPTICSV